MYAFDYRRPSSLDEAERALGAFSGGKLLAGGQTLIPALKLRLNKPDGIVDLGAIRSLAGVALKDGTLSIGAMTTHADVAASREVTSVLPGLAHLAEGIGDPQVRNRGTIGGSLANNDPAADYPAAVLALNATLKTVKRSIAADDFFQGLFKTTLKVNEILTEIVFLVPRRFGYAKFPNPASRFALVGVAIADISSGVRVAVTGAAPGGVFRLPDMEAALAKSFTADAIKGITVDAASLLSDIHADADYRAHLIGVLAKRAVAAAAG